MCGIVGIAGAEAAQKQTLLEEMQTIVQHRGPDDWGSYFSKNIALGHRRLSILDLSPLGKNPMFSYDGRYAITYNGEVFNYRELREEIGERYPFKTNTDTEVVLAAYLVWGAKCVEKFIGMFAFAIWDHQEQTLFCVRDRLGIKPFYYCLTQERFYFASEIKSLLLTGHPREANHATIYQYLKWGVYDHSEETFFSGIKRLLPGHILIWKAGNVSTFAYWDLDEIEEMDCSPADATERIYAILEDSVRLALRADVPIGVNLSGGFDSSVLLMFLDQTLASEVRLQGFTQDYQDRRCSELPWVQEIAQRTQRDVYLSVMTEQNFIDSGAAMLWHQDEPYGGVPVVGYVGMYANAQQQNVTVLLDGNGMDEILSGYRQYHSLFLQTLA